MPWFRFDPALILDDASLDRLDYRYRWLWLQVVALIHRRYPDVDGYALPPREVIQRYTQDGRPRSVRRLLQALGAAGLVVSDSAGRPCLCPSWRLPGPDQSALRVRRYRSRRAALDRPYTGPSLSANGRSDAANSGLTPECNDTEQIIEHCSPDSQSGALVLDPPCEAPPPGAAQGNSDDLTLETWSTPEPEEFRLTAPTNGNGNHQAENARAIFALWQSLPGLEKHRSIQPHYDAITRAIQRWGYSALNIAITRYSEIMTGDYWQYSWSIRDLISRKGGQWIDRLISDDYREHFKKRRPQALDDHYRRLLGGA